MSDTEEVFKQRWGDLPMIPDTESGIAAIEREQITKPRPVEISGAQLYQPAKSESTAIVLPREQCSIDGLTLHTIQLIQHAKKLKSFIQIAQQTWQQDTMVRQSDMDMISNQLTVPPIPPLPETVIKGHIPGNVKYKEQSDFVRGIGVAPPLISPQSTRQILTKCVAAICAHAGFDNTSETVLDTLSDIANEHILRICSLLRVAVDKEALTGNCGFADVMEQVFHEIGLGSITILHDFYQTRVVRYHQHMLSVCQQLEVEYERIKIPQMKSSADVKAFKLKEELVSDIKFPVTEENEATGDLPQTPPLLEELQGALQTMEKAGSTSMKDEEAMKWLPNVKKEESSRNSSPNLDPDEEIINVSDSPEPTLTDVEISQGIPSVSVSDAALSPAGLDSAQSNRPPKKKKKKI